MPDAPFPLRTSKLRRRKLLGADAERLELPHSQYNPVVEAPSEPQRGVSAEDKTRQQANSASRPETNTTPETHPLRSETPSTQDQPSEDAVSTLPTTPSSVQVPQTTSASAVKPVAQSTASAVPAVPVIPALPRAGSKESKPAGGAEKSSANATGGVPVESGETPAEGASDKTEMTTDAVPSTSAPPKPKLWTGLFAKPTPATNQSSVVAASKINGDATAGADSTSGAVSSFAKANTSSLAEALEAYRAGAPDKLMFLEPRGLVNTGNMCYMNSVRPRRGQLSHVCG